MTCEGGGRQNCRFLPGSPRGLLEQQRQQPAVFQPQQQRSHEREQQRGIPRCQAPENRMPVHTARSAGVGESFRSSAVSGTSPPSRAAEPDVGGSNKPKVPSVASRTPKSVGGTTGFPVGCDEPGFDLPRVGSSRRLSFSTAAARGALVSVRDIGEIRKRAAIGRRALARSCCLGEAR